MIDWYAFVGLPLLVFVARMVDVAIGTLRIIFISRGRRLLAPLLGFVEVFIWVSVISQIMRGDQNIFTYLAYAGGFAMGNSVGMFIEDKLALGMLVVRVIVPNKARKLTSNLTKQGFGFTMVDAHGSQGDVKLIYAIVLRKDLPTVANIIEQSHEGAFFTVEELRSAERGVFPRPISTQRQDTFFGRKSK